MSKGPGSIPSYSSWRTFIVFLFIILFPGDSEVLRDALTFSCCTLKSTDKLKCKVTSIETRICRHSTSMSRLIVSSPLIEEDREQIGAYGYHH
jgi:hypothetical protein